MNEAFVTDYQQSALARRLSETPLADASFIRLPGLVVALLAAVACNEMSRTFAVSGPESSTFMTSLGHLGADEQTSGTLGAERRIWQARPAVAIRE